MKIDSTWMRKALAILNRVRGPRKHMPILQTIHVRELPDKVIFTADNLSERIAVEAPASETKEAEWLMDPSRTTDHLKRRKGAVDVTPYLCGADANASGFPEQLAITWDRTYKGDSNWHEAYMKCFRLGIEKPLSESKPALCNVHYDAENHAMVATDGQRLCRVPCDFGDKGNLEIPVTKTLMHTFAKGAPTVLGGKDKHGKKVLLFQTNDVTYVTYLPDTTYPKYYQVIPSYADAEANVVIEDDDAIEVALEMQRRCRKSYLHIAFIPNGTHLNVLSVDDGTPLHVGSNRCWTGHYITVNGEWFLRALNAGFRDIVLPVSLGPAVMRDDEGGLVLIMCCRH